MPVDPTLRPYRSVTGSGARPPMPWTLMYHSVGDTEPDPHNVVVTPTTLERQLSGLRRRGLRGVSIAELLKAPLRRGLVGLTFDDGYADFATTAVPILRRHGFTATVYVLAGRLGGSNDWDTGPRRPLLSAAQVREVAEAGMEVGSHGLRHVRLPALDAAGLAAEVSGSRRELGELLGTEVTGFAYPYDLLGAREVAAVREAGYLHACAVGHSALARMPGPPLALPRSFAGNSDGSARLLAKQIRHGLRGRRDP
jgi:peptidoglycan/xylan/chitin deacetylase (PgdA/CDA1 family)